MKKEKEKLEIFFKDNSGSWSMGVIFAVLFGVVFEGIIWYVLGFIIGWSCGISVAEKKEKDED